MAISTKQPLAAFASSASAVSWSTDEDVRIWMVVGLVNVMKPWLGSTLDGDQIAELINRPNVDVEFTLES